MRSGATVMDSATKLVFGHAHSSPNSVDGIASGTNAFFDKTASLMKALEHVGQVHPFAAGKVAVLLQAHDKD